MGGKVSVGPDLDEIVEANAPARKVAEYGHFHDYLAIKSGAANCKGLECW
jgi:hypothetical protein